MKMHVTTNEIVDIATNIVYGPANEYDIVRKDTSIVYGDAGYVGMGKRVKLDMGYCKTRYRGIKKNAHRLREKNTEYRPVL